MSNMLEELEERTKALESKFEDMDANENDLCAKMNEHDIKLQKLRKRIKAQSARIQCLEARIERLEQAAQPEPFDDEGEVKPRYSHLTCLCGHGALAHYRKKSGRVRCDGNGGKCKCRAYDVTTQAVTTLTAPFAKSHSPNADIEGAANGTLCANCEHTKTWHDAEPEPTEEPTVNTPTVTRERTHGRYGTRNLTKSKPDHIVDAKKVCATCGHPYNEHEIRRGKTFCYGGTFGKPCMCGEYKPVASEG